MPKKGKIIEEILLFPKKTQVEPIWLEYTETDRKTKVADTKRDQKYLGIDTNVLVACVLKR
jgi:hypothetical protein